MSLETRPLSDDLKKCAEKDDDDESDPGEQQRTEIRSDT